jgi:HEAT repeat protein
MRFLPWLLLVLSWALGTPATALGADEDEQMLQSAGLTTDGQALLEFFRTRCRTQVDSDHLQVLARRFTEPSRSGRIQATAELVAWGPLAVPVLRNAANNPDDPELAGRARRCLKWVEGPSSASLSGAAARLVAERKPDGAASVLLEYLPYAESPDVARDVSDAIANVAFAKGSADPAVMRGLTDPLPMRRAAACGALCKAGQPEQFPAVRKLLQDPSPTVRLKAALSLAEANDATAIPVLIDLLAELPAEPRRQVEDYLQGLAGEWAPAMGFQGEDELARRVRRDAWAAWWRNADGSALLAMLRKRTLTTEDRERVRSQIRNLGATTFEEREKAQAELIATGTMALPLLREATRSEDLEIARRAEGCIRGIRHDPAHHLPSAAVRLLSLRRPEGAAEAILAYLPFAEDEAVADEAQRTLIALAVVDGKPDAALVKALTDPDVAVRSAAGEALCRAGAMDVRPAIRKLLKDQNPLVRMRIALALTAAHEREAVPVLIDLLAALPADQVNYVEDRLYQLAGEKAPNALGADADEAAHKKYREAWATWWREQGDKVDLAKLDGTQAWLGYTLLVEVNNNNVGRVVELGRDNKPRWSVGELQYPVDAWVLPGNRVLVAEYNGRKVTERDLKGTIVWQKEGLPGQVVNVQRLSNGNTFIATDSQLLEVDRRGKELYTIAGLGGITSGYRARNGQIICLTAAGRCVRLDTTGKEIKGFPSNRGGGWTSGLDLLANGRILISQPNRNKVIEVDAEGRTLLDVDAPQVTTASGLPNGNVLVASYSSQRVFEVDRKGKVVWEYKGGSAVFRARRR